jgi:hypothetical protein
MEQVLRELRERTRDHELHHERLRVEGLHLKLKRLRLVRMWLQQQ